LVYATVHSLITGQLGPKVLQHDCDSDESSAFVSLHCDKWRM